jgi:hypothetical protein
MAAGAVVKKASEASASTVTAIVTEPPEESKTDMLAVPNLIALKVKLDPVAIAVTTRPSLLDAV